jgi:hypothetical protein
MSGVGMELAYTALGASLLMVFDCLHMPATFLVIISWVAPYTFAKKIRLLSNVHNEYRTYTSTYF